MKLLLLTYRGSTPEKIAALLETHGSTGYTELLHARGLGATGKVEGSRAWPGDATVFFSVVPNEQLAAMRAAVRAYRASEAPGERLHVAQLPLEDFE
jgi:hypothetical protein